MKTLLPVIIWVSSIIAAILILLGLISFLFKCNLLGLKHGVNFFHVANSFFLMAICSLIYKKISDDKENK